MTPVNIHGINERFDRFIGQVDAFFRARYFEVIAGAESVASVESLFESAVVIGDDAIFDRLARYLSCGDVGPKGFVVCAVEKWECFGVWVKLHRRFLSVHAEKSRRRSPAEYRPAKEDARGNVVW